MLVPGTDIWDSLHLWEESKQQHNFQEIGFQLVIAVSGYGILCMLGNLFQASVLLLLHQPSFDLLDISDNHVFDSPANKSVGVQGHWLSLTG